MRRKNIKFSNFSRAIFSESPCVRPDNENDLIDYIALEKPQKILARGGGLSYNDSCLNSNELIINTQRLNHLIQFDPEKGIAICQGAVTFKDLFLLHPEFIPQIIPGTVHATVAGGIAHDVHGKNNHHSGSFGHHIQWFELLIGETTIHCSRDENADLFFATIAGLGLTGIITRVALRLKKASRFVQIENQSFDSFESLIVTMSTYGLNYDYQVAWIDLLNPKPRAILSLANHCQSETDLKEHFHHKVPRLPFSLIKEWNMKLFNKFHFNHRKPKENLSLLNFNNPLDKISHWNRLYGPKGLVQFQAVFDQENAVSTIEKLLQLIRKHHAIPTLAVLKLFIQRGEGLLSFCKPGFTLAIDFNNNEQSKQAILAMNQLITDINGHIYLAKDLLLNQEQFQKMYQHNGQFLKILKNYSCIMNSDLSLRLGITL